MEFFALFIHTWCFVGFVTSYFIINKLELEDFDEFFPALFAFIIIGFLVPSFLIKNMICSK